VYLEDARARAGSACFVFFFVCTRYRSVVVDRNQRRRAVRFNPASQLASYRCWLLTRKPPSGAEKLFYSLCLARCEGFKVAGAG